MGRPCQGTRAAVAAAVAGWAEVGSVVAGKGVAREAVEGSVAAGSVVATAAGWAAAGMMVEAMGVAVG